MNQIGFTDVDIPCFGGGNAVLRAILGKPGSSR